jgi:radical SAM protein with 4Fe4S-binding SPASM domain
MKYSETQVQYSLESFWENAQNAWRRSKGKRLAYLKNRYQWRYTATKRVPDFPLNVDIEASSICQIKCDHCFRQYMDMGEHENMPLDMFKKIAKECGEHKLFTLKFSMRGEPLLNPDIVEMVAYAKEQGIREVWVNTNGGMLTEELATGLFKAKVDWITVSFDGLGKIYESVRRPFKYEESLEKLKMLRRQRDLINPDTILNTQSIFSAIKHNPSEYIDLMKGIVDRVATNPDMNFEEFVLVPDDEYVCPRLWQRIAITSRGNYLKCPSDFQMEEILGTVHEYTVKQAWDILQEQQRQLHLAGHKKDSAVCQKCHHGAKKVPREVKIGDKPETVPLYEHKKQFDGFGAAERVRRFHEERDRNKRREKVS